VARVLVVDDAAFMRKLIADTLRGAGHEIAGEAANGNQAVQLYQQLRPDLVTLDITMPEKDGLAALVKIRAFNPTAKVIMCAALGQEAKIIAALKAGALDFLVKPIDAAELLATIAQVLA
jgi:two-component system chemotaxis response regulator CheY